MKPTDRIARKRLFMLLWKLGLKTAMPKSHLTYANGYIRYIWETIE